MSGVYDNWAEERRGFYSEQAGRVLSALAKLSVSEKRWADALKFSAEVLREDPYREDMHRLTMKVLAAQGKPAAVKKHFDGLKKLLTDELGIEPSAETRKRIVEKGQLVSRGYVVNSAATVSDANHAKVLVFTDQRLTDKDIRGEGAAPLHARSGIELTMVRVDGEWLVDAMVPLQSQ